MCWPKSVYDMPYHMGKQRSSSAEWNFNWIKGQKGHYTFLKNIHSYKYLLQALPLKSIFHLTVNLSSNCAYCKQIMPNTNSLLTNGMSMTTGILAVKLDITLLSSVFSLCFFSFAILCIEKCISFEPQLWMCNVHSISLY